MGEERKDGLIGAVLILIVCVGFLSLFLYSIFYATRPETTELTIEHLWVEDNGYYFSDSRGHVYNLGNIGDEILYEDLPKQRFQKLVEGNVYECVYLSGGAKRISVSEKEIVR